MKNNILTDNFEIVICDNKLGRRLYVSNRFYTHTIDNKKFNFHIILECDTYGKTTTYSAHIVPDYDSLTDYCKEDIIDWYKDEHDDEIGDMTDNDFDTLDVYNANFYCIFLEVDKEYIEGDVAYMNNTFERLANDVQCMLSDDKKKDELFSMSDLSMGCGGCTIWEEFDVWVK